MKRTKYDYSGLSLRTLPQPRFRHLFLLLAWVFYFTMYFLTENLIPAEACHPIHCVIDDWIPFCEYFVVFYVSWYALVFLSLAYYLVYDPPRFSKLQLYILLTQIIAMACYILYPSRQDLRPESFDRQNVFTWAMGIIYAFDTSTGVCPSLHVGYSIAIESVMLKDPYFKPLTKVLVSIWIFFICICVCFVKQHSALDVLFALPMCLVIEILLYGKAYWRPKLRQVRL